MKCRWVIYLVPSCRSTLGGYFRYLGWGLKTSRKFSKVTWSPKHAQKPLKSALFTPLWEPSEVIMKSKNLLFFTFPSIKIQQDIVCSRNNVQKIADNLRNKLSTYSIVWWHIEEVLVTIFDDHAKSQKAFFLWVIEVTILFL